MGDDERLQSATAEKVHKNTSGLPGDPHQGVPNEKVIWKGTTWPHGIFSWCCCSQTWWTVTNRRIDVATGCCKNDQDTIDLRRVTDIKFHRTCGQLLCCRGTLVILTSEGNTQEYEISTWGMHSVYEELREAWLSVRQSTAVVDSGPTQVVT